MSYENLDPDVRTLLQRIDALSENDVRGILAYLAGYDPEVLEEQVARLEAMHVRSVPGGAS